MREPKYRAWDGERMWHNVQNSYDCLGMDSEAFTSAINFDSFGSVIRSCNENDSCALIQYTGLKDKNGVELYEGDIIEVPLAATLKDRHAVVFDRGSFCFIDGHDKWPIGNMYHADIEVIGNIHEHPELLESK